LCPYLGGPGSSSAWPHDPLADIFDEKTDVLLTRVHDDSSESAPVFAVEFVDALMAGNQGWQRFRRAINAAQKGVSYMYVQPVIGWERDSEGLELRHPRFLSALSCLAQLTLCSKFGIPSLQIYTESSWSEYALKTGHTLPNFREFKGIDSAIAVACSLIRLDLEASSQAKDLLRTTLKIIIKEMLSVARTYTKFSNSSLPIHHNHPALQPGNLGIEDEYAAAMVDRHSVTGRYALHEIDTEDFVRFGPLFFKDAQEKTCSANFRDNVLSLLNWKSTKDARYKRRYLRSWGIETGVGLSSDELEEIAEKCQSNLPLTYKENKSEACLITNRKALRDILENAYPRLETKILRWVYPGENGSAQFPIFLIPLYGYKPSGDSRPDRGLVPLLWATFPSLVTKKQTLVIVYSKYTPTEWNSIVRSGGNELWNSVTSIAGALIVDKTGSGILTKDLTDQGKIDSYG
jgi:hypothetical protein